MLKEFAEHAVPKRRKWKSESAPRRAAANRSSCAAAGAANAARAPSHAEFEALPQTSSRESLKLAPVDINGTDGLPKIPSAAALQQQSVRPRSVTPGPAGTPGVAAAATPAPGPDEPPNRPLLDVRRDVSAFAESFEVEEDVLAERRLDIGAGADRIAALLQAKRARESRMRKHVKRKKSAAARSVVDAVAAAARNRRRASRASTDSLARSISITSLSVRSFEGDEAGLPPRVCCQRCVRHCSARRVMGPGSCCMCCPCCHSFALRGEVQQLCVLV